MGIRKKLLLFILIVGITTVLLVTAVSETFVQINIARVEDIQVKDSIRQVSRLLEDKIERIDTFAIDYAGWDDTYIFIQDNNQAYIESNLINETLITTQLNFMLFYNKDRELIFSKAVDLKENIGIFTPENLLNEIKRNEEILTNENTNSVRKGFLVLDDNKIVLLSARPILTSAKEGPIMGTVVFGEFLTEDAIKDIGQRLEKDVEIRAISESITNEVTNIERPNDNYIVGKYEIHDVLDKHALEINVKLPRTYLSESRSHLHYMTIVIIIIGFLSYIAGAIYVDKIVIKPLAKIKSKLDEIGTNKDLTGRIDIKGVVEISQLVSKINNMLETLADYEVQLISLNEELKSENRNIENIVKQRTNDLKKEHANLMATLDAIPDGIAIVDKNFKVLHSNETLQKILEIDKASKQPTMDELKELLSECDEMEDKCKEILEYGKPFQETVIKNSQVFDVYITSIRYSKDKKVIGLVILIRDITEKSLLEESQEDLINVLSHELRTPVTIINGNIGLLRTEIGKESNNLEKLLNTVESASHKLLKMVDNFLTLYKLEQDKLVFDLNEIDISEIIKDILDFHKSSFASKPILIKNKVIAGTKVFADYVKLKLVLENILMNAFKFTEEGEIKISTRKNEEMLEVVISDSGSGISTSNKQHLFKKFVNLSDRKETSKHIASKGMGLYIAKNLLEKMGGSIYLQSTEVGKGSIFVILLPTSKA